MVPGAKVAPCKCDKEMPTNYIDGIPVEFPHIAYACQIKFMESVLKALKNKENALLESPTGTGKTLSLLCAALAWRTAEMGRLQLMEHTTVSRGANYDTIMEISTSTSTGSAFKTINSASGSVSRLQTALNGSFNAPPVDPVDSLANLMVDGHIKAPLIIYASRTHSQLSQVIGELRRTTYHPKIAIVGSRDQMCIHPTVKELGSSSVQSAACTRLTKKKACEFNLRVPEAINHLKRKSSTEESTPCSDQKIMDMEDLIEFASLHKACPYYTSRELLSEADLVFMPYNYLLDKKTRGSNLINFNGAIVIFDEAHNVESSCYDAVSCEISSEDLTQSEKELQHCLELVDSPFFGASLSVSKDSVVAAQTFITNLKTNLSKFEIKSGSTFLSLPGEEIFNAFEAGQQCSPETGEVEIDSMLGSFEEIIKLYLEDQYNRRSGKKSSFQTIVSALRTIYGMDEKQDDDDEGMNEVQAAYTKTRDRIQKRALLMKKSREFYRMVITEQSSSSPSPLSRNCGPTVRSMAYWCFSPGVAIKDLIAMGVRSVVLTSGTLSPMKSFMQEMQIEFHHVLENDHVIDDEQVFGTVVGIGPTGKSLNSSFNQRDSKEYQQELGLTIVNFCRVIPDGILVFFPSYQVMDSCINYWQICRPGGSSSGNIPGAQSIFQMIQQIKSPVIEPKTKGELTVAMERYERIINEAAKDGRNGAIFFAVCRGKVSEGLDFSDAKGRAVIVTGIPYPPFKDPKIILKKQYLQDQSAKSNTNFLSGTEWYNQQASRAVNQALGRVIRHRNDFGAILLCDERFGKAGTIGQLSKWLRGRVNVAASFGEVQGGLARFFKDKPRNVRFNDQIIREPLPLVNSQNQKQASMAKNEFEMQKFKLEPSTSLNGNGASNSSVLEMFKNTTQKSETKKFDWFNTPTESEKTTNPKPATVLNVNTADKEKKEKAQEYLELARKILSKDNFRNFMGLLKTYRAGQIEVSILLTDLVELLNKVPEASDGQVLLEGFETFVPLKHRKLFEQVLEGKTDGTIIDTNYATKDDEIKKRKLHSDFVGKRPSVSIEAIILKRKLSINGGSLEFEEDPKTKKNPSMVEVVEPCPICKDTLNDPFKAKCNHVACFECWNAWLGRTLECPLCRQRTRVSQLKRLNSE